ncbi:hypothetical protein Sango_2057500 [Sesamum angolense]|uniref:Uncharacterized protein n=1 Tax=Sesamum angolense TaxID=2727404 RepID=A0AAE1WG73_9LAMI|nr:hypothetical protein Sango_2057500 [Sesamum angolense]
MEKRLLDLVKEVRVCSDMTLEEPSSYEDPRPVKKSVICQKCNGSFLAPFVVKAIRRSSASKLQGNALARSSFFKKRTPFSSVQSKSSLKITRKNFVQALKSDQE